MDLSALLGLGGGLFFVLWAVEREAGLLTLASPHGVGLVLGGTLCAVLINSSARDVWRAARAAAGVMLAPRHPSAREMIPVLVALCRRAREEGAGALRGAEAADDGFLARAVEAALVLGDLQSARRALENELNQLRSRHVESANVLRVAGILAPMFGLLGTLVGIIAVLRGMTNPALAGRGMAVAISSAFYGILLANLLFVPLANRLRARSMAERLAKEVVMVGILEIVFSQRGPLALETLLATYLSRAEAVPEAGA